MDVTADSVNGQDVIQRTAGQNNPSYSRGREAECALCLDVWLHVCRTEGEEEEDRGSTTQNSLYPHQPFSPFSSHQGSLASQDYNQLQASPGESRDKDWGSSVYYVWLTRQKMVIYHLIIYKSRGSTSHLLLTLNTSKRFGGYSDNPLPPGGQRKYQVWNNEIFLIIIFPKEYRQSWMFHEGWVSQTHASRWPFKSIVHQLSPVAIKTNGKDQLKRLTRISSTFQFEKESMAFCRVDLLQLCCWKF